MRFFNFLESRYVSVNLELQKEFTIAKQAETQAIQALINMNRAFHRMLAYPKVIIHYFLVNLHILKVPLTPKEIMVQVTQPKEDPPQKPQLAAVPASVEKVLSEREQAIADNLAAQKAKATE